MSRSVTTPVNVSPSRIGSEPTSSLAISSAASVTRSPWGHAAGASVMCSWTFGPMVLLCSFFFSYPPRLISTPASWCCKGGRHQGGSDWHRPRNERCQSLDSYRRNVRVAGRLVRPETSRARSVIVYRPSPRKRCAGSQLRVYAPHGRGGTRVAKRLSAGGTPGRVSRTRMPRLRGWSSQTRKRT